MPPETETVDNETEVATTSVDDTSASSVEKDAKPGSLLDAVKNAAKDKGVKLTESSPEGEPTEEPEEDDEPEDKGSEAKPVKKAESEPEKKEEPEGKEEPQPEKKDELVELSEKFAKNPGVQNLIARYNEQKPEVEYAKRIKTFQQTNRIPDQLMEAGMQMMALLANDRATALKQLEPLVAQLKEENGLGELPADLKQAVAEGEMSEAWARKLAASQAQSRIAAESAQRQQATLTANANKTALETWQENKVRSDADFVKKYPLVEAEFLRIVTFEKAATQEQLVAAAEKAYAKVNDQLKAFVPKPPARKTFRPTGSSAETHRAEPKTLRDVVASAYARHQ